MSFQEFFLAANRIGPEILNIILLFPQTFEFKSTTKRFWGSTWFVFILMDSVIWLRNTEKFTKTGLDPFIKYLIFAAAKASYIVLIRISMIPRIIVLFHRSPLSMVTPAKISNETMFILYFFLYGEHIKVFRKFSWRFLKRRFYQFRNGVLLLSKILQIKFFLKD